MPTEVLDIFSVVDYPRDVDRAAQLLRDGSLVVLPTETVYGAAGLLTNPSGRQRLKAFRGDAPDAPPRPFTIHVGNRHHAEKYLGPLTDLARRLMTKLWPGPVALTFEVPAARRAEVAAQLKLPESQIYDGDTITLRCADHVVTDDILDKVEGPVALTVASTSGAENAREVRLFVDEVQGKVKLIVDSGPTRFNKPSTILRVHDDRYTIERAGIYDERIIERLLRTTVLFVCSGNTCRSPMAEALARRILAERMGVSQEDLEKKGVSMLSAGSFAMPGSRAAAPAIEVVKRFGADLTKHRSRPLSVELIHQADVIFTMSRAHAQSVLALVPAASEKTFTLDPEKDIEDPIGGDVSLYQELAGQLNELIDRRLKERVPTA